VDKSMLSELKSLVCSRKKYLSAIIPK